MYFEWDVFFLPRSTTNTKCIQGSTLGNIKKFKWTIHNRKNVGITNMHKCEWEKWSLLCYKIYGYLCTRSSVILFNLTVNKFLRKFLMTFLLWLCFVICGMCFGAYWLGKVLLVVVDRRVLAYNSFVFCAFPFFPAPGSLPNFPIWLATGRERSTPRSC